MLLLALDTSTRQASVALCTEQSVLGEYTWQVGNNHSVELLERIQRLFAECGTTMQALDAVAVATGPGSFNGLRVALTTAKSLAFALQKPLVGVSTLDIIAAQHHDWPGPICALLEAGRSELYVVCYTIEQIASEGRDETDDTHDHMQWRMRRLSDYLVQSPQEVSTLLQQQIGQWLGVPGERELPTVLFCGEIGKASRQALLVSMQSKSIFVSPLESARHASVLASLALQQIQNGREDDPLVLEPLYIRRPSITTSTRKQPLLGGKSHRPAGHSQTEREEGALRH
ncbi:MAG: tRNA (adenosine(37)-N6)-threonylcarbamoyltransferase complex dimerization subunit type 1 TsaB [Ktedonobacteraceae bacterium]